MLNKNIYSAQMFNGVNVGDAQELNQTIFDVLEKHHKVRGNSPFLTTTKNGNLSSLTFSEFYEFVLKGASWLEDTVSSGDKVALVLQNDQRGVVAAFSILRLGASVLILDPNSPEARHKSLIDAVGSETIVDACNTPHVSELKFPELDNLPNRKLKGAGKIDPQSLAFLVGTSGSTASSKIVCQSHRATIANALAMIKHHRLGPGIRFMGCLPIHHVNGMHLTVVANLVAGSETFLVEGFDPFLYPQQLERFDPHIASVVPSILEVLLTTWRRPKLGSSLRYFITAAAPLQADTAAKVWDRWRTRVIQGYGLSETINFSTTMPVGIDFSQYSKLVLEAEIPSVGVAVYGNQFEVRRPDGTEASEFEIGEVCIRGFNVMDRYVSNLDANVAAFADGIFHTGDLGYWHSYSSSDRYLTLTGRLKNTANVGGETVSLEEIERMVKANEQVDDCVCVGVPDRLLGEQLLLLYSGPTNADEKIFGSLQAMLPPGALKCKIIRISKIPRTVTGKILRGEIQKQAQSFY